MFQFSRPKDFLDFPFQEDEQTPEENEENEKKWEKTYENEVPKWFDSEMQFEKLREEILKLEKEGGIDVLKISKIWEKLIKEAKSCKDEKETLRLTEKFCEILSTLNVCTRAFKSIGKLISKKKKFYEYLNIILNESKDITDQMLGFVVNSIDMDYIIKDCLKNQPEISLKLLQKYNYASLSDFEMLNIDEGNKHTLLIEAVIQQRSKIINYILNSLEVSPKAIQYINGKIPKSYYNNRTKNMAFLKKVNLKEKSVKDFNAFGIALLNLPKKSFEEIIHDILTSKFSHFIEKDFRDINIHHYIKSIEKLKESKM